MSNRKQTTIHGGMLNATASIILGNIIDSLLRTESWNFSSTQPLIIHIEIERSRDENEEQTLIGNIDKVSRPTDTIH